MNQWIGPADGRDWLPDGWVYADPPVIAGGTLTPYDNDDDAPVLLEMYSFRAIEAPVEYTPQGPVRWFDVALVQSRYVARRALSIQAGAWQAHPPATWGFDREDLNIEAARMFAIAAPRLANLMIESAEPFSLNRLLKPVPRFR